MVVTDQGDRWWVHEELPRIGRFEAYVPKGATDGDVDRIAQRLKTLTLERAWEAWRPSWRARLRSWWRRRVRGLPAERPPLPPLPEGCVCASPGLPECPVHPVGAGAPPSLWADGDRTPVPTGDLEPPPSRA